MNNLLDYKFENLDRHVKVYRFTPEQKKKENIDKYNDRDYDTHIDNTYRDQDNVKI